MTTYISILRGINVSGHRMIKMDALKKMCAELGFSNIRTYIQSGNIVFQAKETATQKLSELIESVINKTFGFDVPAIILTKDELENIIKSNPFVKDETKNASFFHVTFLSGNPAKENIELLQQADLKNDEYAVGDKAIYLYCPDSYSNSKLTNSFFENKLKVIATTRNWKTTNELLNMA